MIPLERLQSILSQPGHKHYEEERLKGNREGCEWLLEHEDEHQERLNKIVTDYSVMRAVTLELFEIMKTKPKDIPSLLALAKQGFKKSIEESLPDFPESAKDVVSIIMMKRFIHICETQQESVNFVFQRHFGITIHGADIQQNKEQR